MHRRVPIVIGSLLTVLVAAVFYYAFIAPAQSQQAKVQKQEKQEASAPAYRHPLNGVPLEEKRDFFAISVMYDNLAEVAKHPGLDQARIVYEALAEGGITRFMAVYDSTQQVAEIGPVRSVRPYFIDWAMEYGGALMHVGGSQDALQQFKKIPDSDLVDVDQIGADEQYFSRNESLKAPHNVFTNFSSWLKLGERLDIKPKTITSWKFDEIKAPSEDSQQIDIAYSPGNHVSWVYNGPAHTYVRFLNANRQLATTGEQLRASSVVLLEVPSSTIDAIGRQKMKTLGSGPAVMYAGGRTQTGTWIKETRASRMRFIGEDQQELTLAPGTIWIEVVPDLAMSAYQGSGSVSE